MYIKQLNDINFIHLPGLTVNFIVFRCVFQCAQAEKFTSEQL